MFPANHSVAVVVLDVQLMFHTEISSQKLGTPKAFAQLDSYWSMYGTWLLDFTIVAILKPKISKNSIQYTVNSFARLGEAMIMNM